MQHIFNYDINRYNFQEVLKDLFKVSELHLLHEHLPKLYVAPDGTSGLGNDTHSIYHTQFYDKIRGGWHEFIDIYNGFIINELASKFKDEKRLIYQALPSFRIQYPTGKAVTTWHCDNDENHKHPLGELNILIPLSNSMYGSNAVWAESLPGLGDFAPMECAYGEYIIWNGNRCRHGNKPNTTGLTRVSMDLRILPEKCYNENYSLSTATTGMKFKIGEYYESIEV
jgi:hypothetical protein